MVRQLMIELAKTTGMRGFHAGALAHSSAAGGARAGACLYQQTRWCRRRSRRQSCRLL